MAVNIVTGMTGKLHITSDDDRYRNAATFGKGKHVLNFGSKFAATVQSANLVRIMDGMLVNQGTQMGIELEDYEDVAIENGITGLNRNDIIVMRYIKTEETSVEQAVIEVVSGTSTSGTPQDPALTTGNILDGGDLVDDMPLYRVKVRGLTIEGLDTLFTVWQSDMEKNRDDIANLSNTKADQTAMTTELNKKVNKSDIQTSVNTSGNPVSSNAVNTALALKANSTNAWLLSGEVVIPANTDLNSYTGLGNYYCSTDVAAATLKNSPITGAFIMKVIYATGNGYVTQIIRAQVNGDIWFRRYVNNEWKEWVKNPTRSEITAINQEIANIEAGALKGAVMETVYDTQGAKNLLEITADSQTINGVTFTVDRQAGTVTANGTANGSAYFKVAENVKFKNGRYIFSGGVSSDLAVYFYDSTEKVNLQISTGTDVTYNISDSHIYDVFIYAKTGITFSNKILKPMLRPAAYVSSTFAPYAKSNRELTLDAAVLPENAGKNLLKITADSQTVNGITYTIDKVSGIIKLNGTTGGSYSQIAVNPRLPIQSGNYVLSSGINTSDAYFYLSGTAASETRGKDEAVFSLTSDFSSAVYLYIPSGKTLNNLTFYPMLRPAGTSPDFAPYMYSNHEITTMMQGNENKNLLEITAESQTINGVTFTVDKKAGTVTANGAASADRVTLPLLSTTSMGNLLNLNVGGEYSISGDSGNVYVLLVTESGANITGTFVYDGRRYYVGARINNSGTTVTNVLIKPMIRYANTPPDFVPYRKTNEVLTKEIDERWRLSGGIAIPSGADLNNYTAVGNYYCNSDSYAANLKNSPVTVGFTLKVFYGDGLKYPCQKMETLVSHEVHTRMYSIDGSRWLEWVKTPTRAEITSINTTLSGKVNTSDIQTSVNTSGNPVSSNAVNSALAGKANTTDVNNALNGKVNTSSVTSSITQNSGNPITSGAVYGLQNRVNNWSAAMYQVMNPYTSETFSGFIDSTGYIFIPIDRYIRHAISSAPQLAAVYVNGSNVLSSTVGLPFNANSVYGDVSAQVPSTYRGRVVTATLYIEYSGSGFPVFSDY